MDGKDFSGLHRHLRSMSGPTITDATPDEAYAVAGILVQRGAVTPVRVPVMQRSIVLVKAAEDVAKRERATVLEDGGIGGRGDAEFTSGRYQDRTRMDAWWLRATARGAAGPLKLGEPPTDAELAEYA